jgi:hypothetical protein
VYRVGPADGLGAGLGKTDVLDLPFRHELRKCADSVLDRGAGVDAVLVVEVDVLGVEPLQRACDRGADVGGAAVELAGTAAGVGDKAEFRSEDDLLAMTLQRPAEQLLVVIGP